MRPSPRILAGAAALCICLGVWPREAHAVTQCGDQSDTCQCGANNPFPCCDNGGNCTWWAWQAACCNWGVSVPMLGNANTWAGVAASDPNYTVLPNPVPNSIGCRASGSYGHVVWVTAVDGSTISVTEMNCWGNYGMRTATYNASYFDGGYIVLKSSLCGCTAGETENQTCGTCGQQTRTCGSDCQWGAWGDCAGADPGTACDTGNKGVCAAGSLRCVNGDEQCDQTTQSSAEVCDGLDNDCDGTADEEDVCGVDAAAPDASTGGSGGGPGSGGSTGADGAAGKDGSAETGPSADGGNVSEAGGDAVWSYTPESCACRIPGERPRGSILLWLAALLPWVRRR